MEVRLTKPTLIHSVVRALRLLDAVGASAVPLTAKQLARRAGLPLSTAYHLLRTLEHEEYLQRTRTGYVLGDRALHGADGPGIDTRRARAALVDLHAATGAPAYLAALRGEEIWIVDIVDSPDNPRVDLWVGMHDSAHATALGKAILRAMTPEQRADYLAGKHLADLTPRTITTPGRLLADLAHAEFTVDHQEYAVGTSCLAIPLHAGGGPAAVAISVSAAKAGTLHDHAASLRRAATRLSLDTAA